MGTKMKLNDLMNEDAYSDGLPKGFKKENQVWRTVGIRLKGKQGNKSIPGGMHKVRIDKPTGIITGGMFTGTKIDDLHSTVKSAKKRGIVTRKDKNGKVIRDPLTGKISTVSKNTDIVKKKKKYADLKNISNRDKERLKNSQHSKRDIDKEINKIDDYIRKNKPVKKGVNKKADERIDNLEQQRKHLLNARGSTAVATANTAGLSTYSKKDAEGKKTRADYHKEREEYSKGANYSKAQWRAVRDKLKNKKK